jgi:hypothetical protein
MDEHEAWTRIRRHLLRSRHEEGHPAEREQGRSRPRSHVSLRRFVRRRGVVPLFVATVVVSGAAAALAVTQPVANYPADPRTIGGGSPYDALPKADECSQARGQSAGGYTSLAKLPHRVGKSPFVSGDVVTETVDLKNAKGQTFRLYVSAGSRKTVDAYLARVTACAEAFPLTSAAPRVIASVPLWAYLVIAARDETQRSQDALSGLRDQLAAAGQPSSLANVIAAANGSATAALDASIPPVKKELARRVAAQELTAAEVAGLNLRGMMKALETQPYAPFLNRQRVDASSPATAGRALASDPQSVLVGIQPLTTLPTRAAVWAAFAFSRRQLAGAAGAALGPLDAGHYHYFVAKCQLAASAQIWAKSGGAQLKLWRVSDWSGYATSYATSGASSRLYASASKYRTYDTWVKGLLNGTYYSMYYGWVRGSGGGC